MQVKGMTKESSEMVELVYGLHHMSPIGDQRKFWNSGACAWALR